MFSCFSFTSFKSRGFFDDRWQEDDHYYEFPQLYPGKNAWQGGEGRCWKQSPVVAIFDRAKNLYGT
jgi:hypothetical protein